MEERGKLETRLRTLFDLAVDIPVLSPVAGGFTPLGSLPAVQAGPGPTIAQNLTLESLPEYICAFTRNNGSDANPRHIFRNFRSKREVMDGEGVRLCVPVVGKDASKGGSQCQRGESGR